MTYEQATKDLELLEVGVAEASIISAEGSAETIEEVFVTDEGIVGEAPADVTVH